MRILLTALAALASVCARAAEPESWPAVQEVLRDASLAGAGGPPVLRDAGPEHPFYSFALPSESPAQPAGLCWSTEREGRARSALPLVVGLFCRSHCRVLAPAATPLAITAGEAVARRFLEKHFAWFWALPGEQVYREGRPSPQGELSCRWIKLRPDGFPAADVAAVVRLPDGRIVPFDAGPNLRDWPPHRVSPSQACATALQAAARGGITVQVSDWDLVADELPMPIYSVCLERREPGARRAVTGRALIDADTGKLVFPVRWHEPDPAEIYEVHDTQPVWANGTLAFVGKRSLAGLPDWCDPPAQLLVQRPGAPLGAATLDLEQGVTWLAGTVTSTGVTVRRLAEGLPPFGHLIDTVSGDYRTVVAGDDEGHHACPSPDGRWVVSSCEARDRGRDLFVDEVRRPGALALRRGRVVLPGLQDLPCFSPDGRTLYFVDLEPPYTARWARLCRMATDAVLKVEIVRPAPDAVEFVCRVPSDGHRLSSTPDGRRLVLQADSGSLVINLDDRSCTPLKLERLTDPDLGVAVTQPEDAWAGPGDEQVTFSGKTVDKLGVQRRRLYACRFDGTGLAALTPAANTPVPACTFGPRPSTGVDLTEALALAELDFEWRWQARHPRR